MLGADRVQGTPIGMVEDTGHETQEARRLRQLGEPTQGADDVGYRHIDQDAGHGLGALGAVDALADGGGWIASLGLQPADQEMRQGVQQQEARRQRYGRVLREAHAGTLEARLKTPGPLGQSGLGGPATQQGLIQGEEDAFAEEFHGWQPFGSAVQVWRNQLSAGLGNRLRGEPCWAQVIAEVLGDAGKAQEYPHLAQPGHGDQPLNGGDKSCWAHG